MKMFVGLLMLLVSPVFGAGDATRAKGLVRAYDQKFDQWVAEVKGAKSEKVRAAAWGNRPNSKGYGEAIWKEIRPNLTQSWTLEYAAWMMSTTPEILSLGNTPQSNPLALIRKACKSHHVKSPRVGPYCLALTIFSDPSDMAFLKLVEKHNPDAAVRGAAALGQAILLRKLGDDPKVMQERFAKLNMAIKSPDLKIGRTTLLKLAEDETFRTTQLSIGAQAPDIRGIDITGEIFNLSDYRGKVVVFVFWNTWMQNAEETIGFLKELHAESAGKDLVVIGANQDNVLALRELTKNGETPWRNFVDDEQEIAVQYRIARWPSCFVLDKSGKIQYKGDPGPFVRISAMSILGQ